MEQPHLSSHLDYLEEKYQEALGQIAKLQQHVEKQEFKLQEQTHQIRNLEERLSQVRAESAYTPQLDGQLEHLRNELLQAVDQRLSRLLPTQPNPSSEILSQQLVKQGKAVAELRREIDKTSRYDDQIALAQAESARLNQEFLKFQGEIASLGKQLEERFRPFTYLEEQYRGHTRILADLQSEIPPLRKNVDANFAKMGVVEQKIPQFAKFEMALDGLREDLRRHRERMDYQVAQRERNLNDWTKLADTMERRIKENESSMSKYTEHYQLNKRALASLQDFQERLQNEQHRFRELQRLAEERQRTELEKFRTDFEQRWQKRSMEFEPQFSNFHRSIESVQKRIEEVAKLYDTYDEQMSMLLQIIEEDIQSRTAASNSWQERFEELANGRA